jgi:hypothetical protein
MADKLERNMDWEVARYIGDELYELKVCEHGWQCKTTELGMYRVLDKYCWPVFRRAEVSYGFSERLSSWHVTVRPKTWSDVIAPHVTQ